MKEPLRVFQMGVRTDCEEGRVTLLVLTLRYSSLRYCCDICFCNYAIFVQNEDLFPYHYDSFFAITSLSWLRSSSSFCICPLHVLTCFPKALHCWQIFSCSSSNTYNLPVLLSNFLVISFFSSRQCRWFSSAYLSTAFRCAMTCPSLHREQWELCCFPAALNLLTSSFRLPIWHDRFSISSLSFHSLNAKNSSCLASLSSYCLVKDSILMACSSFFNCMWYSVSPSASSLFSVFLQHELLLTGRLPLSSMDSLVLSLRYWSMVFLGSFYSGRWLSKLKLMWLQLEDSRAQMWESWRVDMRVTIYYIAKNGGEGQSWVGKGQKCLGKEGIDRSQVRIINNRSIPITISALTAIIKQNEKHPGHSYSSSSILNSPSLRPKQILFSRLSISILSLFICSSRSTSPYSFAFSRIFTVRLLAAPRSTWLEGWVTITAMSGKRSRWSSGCCQDLLRLMMYSIRFFLFWRRYSFYCFSAIRCIFSCNCCSSFCFSRNWQGSLMIRSLDRCPESLQTTSFPSFLSSPAAMSTFNASQTLRLTLCSSFLLSLLPSSMMISLTSRSATSLYLVMESCETIWQTDSDRFLSPLAFLELRLGLLRLFPSGQERDSYQSTSSKSSYRLIFLEMVALLGAERMWAGGRGWLLSRGATTSNRTGLGELGVKKKEPLLGEFSNAWEKWCGFWISEGLWLVTLSRMSSLQEQMQESGSPAKRLDWSSWLQKCILTQLYCATLYILRVNCGGK